MSRACLLAHARAVPWASHARARRWRRVARLVLPSASQLALCAHSHVGRSSLRRCRGPPAPFLLVARLTLLACVHAAWVAAESPPHPRKCGVGLVLEQHGFGPVVVTQVSCSRPCFSVSLCARLGLLSASGRAAPAAAEQRPRRLCHSPAPRAPGGARRPVRQGQKQHRETTRPHFVGGWCPGLASQPPARCPCTAMCEGLLPRTDQGLCNMLNCPFMHAVACFFAGVPTSGR